MSHAPSVVKLVLDHREVEALRQGWKFWGFRRTRPWVPKGNCFRSASHTPWVCDQHTDLERWKCLDDGCGSSFMVLQCSLGHRSRCFLSVPPCVCCGGFRLAGTRGVLAYPPSWAQTTSSSRPCTPVSWPHGHRCFCLVFGDTITTTDGPNEATESGHLSGEVHG